MCSEDLVIPKLFAKSAAGSSFKTALQIQEGGQWKRLTYQELETQVLKTAGFLIKQGFKKGDFAGLILENCPEWAVIYLGIIRAGLICVPLDIQLSGDEIKNLILDCNTKILFCSEEILIKKINPDIRGLLHKIVVLTKQSLPQPFNADEKYMSFSEIENTPFQNNLLGTQSSEDTVCLIYTSGTTDQPKGVLLTHKNICSNFLSIFQLKLCFPDDNFLALLPLHHTYSLMATLIVPLFSGAEVTFPPLGFNPKDLSSLIKQAKITILAGVPQLFFSVKQYYI
ncbi:MAG: AMP-binding protein [Candidatus Omnitrophota bacterium]